MLSSILHLLLVRFQELLIDSDLRWGQCWRGNKLQSGVTNELPSQPQEGLLEVVVRLGGDVVILEVLLAMERNGLGFDLAFLHVDLISSEDDGNILADSNKVT